MRFTVRDHRPQDFDTLWKIDQACFPPGISYSRYELKLYIGRRGVLTLVAEASGESSPGQAQGEDRILGFLVAELGRRSIGHIITIDVCAEARRQRVGSVLLDTAESRLRSQCQFIRLETAVDNVAALSFYKRHGYSVIKTVPRYYSNGVDALLLEKDLLLPVSSR